jgi:hypothetical protein
MEFLRGLGSSVMPLLAIGLALGLLTQDFASANSTMGVRLGQLRALLRQRQRRQHDERGKADELPAAGQTGN